MSLADSVNGFLDSVQMLSKTERRIQQQVLQSMEEMTIDIKPHSSLLDRAATATDGVLIDARAQVQRLDDEIADLQEKRRQALIVIAAFEPAQKHLIEGEAQQPKRKARG